MKGVCEGADDEMVGTDNRPSRKNVYMQALLMSGTCSLRIKWTKDLLLYRKHRVGPVVS